MRIASLALTVTLLSSTVAYAEFTIPDCTELRRFPIGVIVSRIDRDTSDRTLYDFFGVDLFEFEASHADRIADAILDCDIPGGYDAPKLRGIMGDVIEIADEVRADIQLEIEGDRAEYLASQEADRSPPADPNEGRRQPLGDDEDLRAAETLQPFMVLYQIADLCAQSETSFTARDVDVMDARIRQIIEETNISDARLDLIWTMTAGAIETSVSQMTTQDCVRSRQQANYLFEFPPTTTPNPFAR